MRYAEHTAVSAERSKAEIEKLLSKYGAEQFVSGWDKDCAKIGFRLHDRHVRFVLMLPAKNDPKFQRTPSGRKVLCPEVAWKVWEQATRQRWRALALVVKAKLEAVESGITTFESEFMAFIVMPNGKTVGEMAMPLIEGAYKSGKMPQVLLTGW